MEGDVIPTQDMQLLLEPEHANQLVLTHQVSCVAFAVDALVKVKFQPSMTVPRTLIGRTAVVSWNHKHLSLLRTSHWTTTALVADDDSSVHAQMKWNDPDWMTHNNLTRLPKIWSDIKQEFVTRPHGGKLRHPHPEPKFLADPQHQTKLFGEKLFCMESKTNENDNGLNKVDCFALKKNFGCVLKQIRTLPKTEWLLTGAAALEHHFEDHSCCGDWCKRRSVSAIQLEEERKSTDKQ